MSKLLGKAVQIKIVSSTFYRLRIIAITDFQMSSAQAAGYQPGIVINQTKKWTAAAIPPSYRCIWGKAPRWLFSRMVKLGGALCECVIDSYGEAELLRRLSDPHQFPGALLRHRL